MIELEPVDVEFDFRTDTGIGRDPDSASPTLRRYHQLLWSRPLPSGAPFELDRHGRGTYLHHASGLGEFWLGSDSIIHTYSYWERTATIIAQVPKPDLFEFKAAANTIGGYILFPNNKIVGSQSINQRRGTSRLIDDRFDLTLECIRRHYLGEREGNPLAETLSAYSDFFDLFESFRGYVEFFLLQDLVTDDHASIRWFIPFVEFEKPAHPADLERYLAYRQNCMMFVKARNDRIRDYVASLGQGQE